MVAQLVEVLRYKPEGHRFDSQGRHWNFSLTYSFWPHYGPALTECVTVMSTFPGCKSVWCIGLSTLPRSCADCLANLGASNSSNPQGLGRDCFAFTCEVFHLGLVQLSFTLLQ